ncbi:hypothetical protein PanWU01x14_304760 [Parasponia andersonii]|uniref:Uncharacterized protein n=1 Tax=Parasponia andersonii TaxID=3476 RepID=A0A2P5ASI1_PARAD|nr:hypothetical protein PanWU01x14_304760 [Parasponia andersonii]
MRNLLIDMNLKRISLEAIHAEEEYQREMEQGMVEGSSCGNTIRTPSQQEDLEEEQRRVQPRIDAERTMPTGQGHTNNNEEDSKEDPVEDPEENPSEHSNTNRRY